MHFDYNLILYHVYYAFMPSIIYIWTNFVKVTFSKSIIFKVKSIFEPNVLKSVIKTIFISSSPLSLLNINVKWFSILKKWCTFGRKIRCLKKTKTFNSQNMNVLNMQKKIDLCQALSMQNLQLMENIPKKIMTIQLLCFLYDLSNI